MIDDEQSCSVQDQLQEAARELWTRTQDVGKDFIVFVDRRNMLTRVKCRDDGLFEVSWESDTGDDWVGHGKFFDNPREAAFHGYQGPH